MFREPNACRPPEARLVAPAIAALLAITATAATAEDFESFPAGPVGKSPSALGTFVAGDGHAEIIAGKGLNGGKALRIHGGTNRTVTIDLAAVSGTPRLLSFHAERWTARGSFDLSIEANTGSSWSLLKRGPGVKVGGYHTHLSIEVPARAKSLRITCTSEAGVLIDDLALNRAGPMEITGITARHPVIPVLRRKPVNPVIGFSITTEGNRGSPALEAVELSLEGSTKPSDIARIELIAADKVVASAAASPPKTLLTGNIPLASGDNRFTVSVRLHDTADIDAKVAVRLLRVKAGGKTLVPDPSQAPARPLRVGEGLRLQGDDGSHSYRIPGLVRSGAGSMLAVYDVRHNHCGDLPAKIDVGLSRSTDGGQTWEAMRIAMHCGTMGDEYAKDGVGDPSILVDEKTGRIWLAALWSHGNRAWNGSGPGMTPAETGQFLLSHSDDDGKTWSPLRNITPQIKDPAWRLVFNGPGAGIAMKDGTLVFPAQFRAADGGETKGKPFSTVITSKDRGETWSIGGGCRIDTTEAQVVETEPGTLMLNCRDNRGGSRTVMITRDLGKTWTPHATDRSALPEPVCMASLLRWDHPGRETIFVFSNPAATNGRHHMTLKFSKDLAATWPEKWHLLYDERGGAGYSCLAPAGDDHIGVLYEGPCELYFLRVPLKEVFGD